MAFAGGVLLGAAPYLSYALLTVGALVLAVLLVRRPPKRLVLALDLSGVTGGEVERIWLPYAAWMGTVTGFLRPPARGWPARQALVALVTRATMGSPW